MSACRSPQSTIPFVDVGSLKYAEGLMETGSQTSRRRIDWALGLERKLQGLERQREGFRLGASAQAEKLRLKRTQVLKRCKWHSSGTRESSVYLWRIWTYFFPIV
ncbi:hypothetical protein Pyn_13440 [Prunus yedoensis var. nudiflora]|uniref:Uncharacterized protein n=1 Tax=Prunus yedoensis var. nudiflora TaxID=2094558 RepID=A0A314YNV7_PRUYE|nr:hypothetical protein Pyn_13440 [Prunus yedoensis var. nudiflora]